MPTTYIIAIINARVIAFEVSTKSHQIILDNIVSKRAVVERHHGLGWTNNLNTNS